MSASLDSAAPTNPTGQPTMAAGRGAPSTKHLQQVEQCGRGVADGNDRAAQDAAPTTRRRPRCGWCSTARARAGTPGSFRKQCTSLAAGSRPRGDPGGDHACIAQNGRTGLQRSARGGHELGMDDEVVDQVRLTAAVDHPHSQFLGFRRNVRQVGFATDGGERVRVDGGAVGDVVVAPCRPVGIARLGTCHRDTSGAFGTRMPRQGVTTTCGDVCRAFEQRLNQLGCQYAVGGGHVGATGHRAVGQRWRRSGEARIGGGGRLQRPGQLADVPRRIGARPASIEKSRRQINQTAGGVTRPVRRLPNDRRRAAEPRRRRAPHNPGRFHAFRPQ